MALQFPLGRIGIGFWTSPKSPAEFPVNTAAKHVPPLTIFL